MLRLLDFKTSIGGFYEVMDVADIKEKPPVCAACLQGIKANWRYQRLLNMHYFVSAKNLAFESVSWSIAWIEI